MIFPRNNIIQTRALKYRYGRHHVLNSKNLEVPIGSIFGFLGPNGAGKSTTIKTLN
jgi:ABC-type multidrug transport system ATPase subunit